MTRKTPVPIMSTPPMAPINPPMRTLFGDVEETSEVDDIPRLDGIGGSKGEISKISIVFEARPLLFTPPPPKKIFFVDDVAASEPRGCRRMYHLQMQRYLQSMLLQATFDFDSVLQCSMFVMLR
jgi:hypothetical protein